MTLRPEPTALPDASATPRTASFDYLLGQLRDVVAPAARQDPVASSRIKGMARVPQRSFIELEEPAP